ncbi:hypothetical protein ACSI0N_004264 [Escherichia coli]
MKNSKFVVSDFSLPGMLNTSVYAEYSPADNLLPDCNPDKNILL